MISFDKFCDDRKMSGYKSALLYKEYYEELYHLLLPLENAPTVVGSLNTFDVDLLTCPTIGKVEGKESLDDKEVDFLWHRDNVIRLEDLQGKVLDFMVVYQDFTARTFTGTIRVRPQDATADVMRGTFTITPYSASIRTLPNARDLIMDTIIFTQPIPSSLIIGDNGVSVDLKTNPYFSVTEAGAFDKALVVFSASVDNSNFVTTVTQVTSKDTPASIKITKKTDAETSPQYGVVTITAYDAEYWDTATNKPKENKKPTIASWSTTIAVEY